jgi:hypothetical protein
MDIKLALRQVAESTRPNEWRVEYLMELCTTALAEIKRLEQIEANAKELYEYRQDAFPSILAAENIQLVLDGLECKLFPERFRDASNR